MSTIRRCDLCMAENVENHLQWAKLKAVDIELDVCFECRKMILEIGAIRKHIEAMR